MIELTDEQLEIIADKVALKLTERESKVNQSQPLPGSLAWRLRELGNLKKADLIQAAIKGGELAQADIEADVDEVKTKNYLTEAEMPKFSQSLGSDSEDTEEKQKTYVSLELSPEENEILEIIANKKNETKNQVLRKAIALMNLAVQAGELGLQLGIGKEGHIDTEIVGL